MDLHGRPGRGEPDSGRRPSLKSGRGLQVSPYGIWEGLTDLPSRRPRGRSNGHRQTEQELAKAENAEKTVAVFCENYIASC